MSPASASAAPAGVGLQAEATAKNIIIIGGEGDLALRKLYPALYSLDQEGLLAPEVKITAFGRGFKNRVDLTEPKP